MWWLLVLFYSCGVVIYTIIELLRMPVLIDKTHIWLLISHITLGIMAFTLFSTKDSRKKQLLRKNQTRNLQGIIIRQAPHFKFHNIELFGSSFCLYFRHPGLTHTVLFLVNITMTAFAPAGFLACLARMQSAGTFCDVRLQRGLEECFLIQFCTAHLLSEMDIVFLNQFTFERLDSLHDIGVILDGNFRLIDFLKQFRVLLARENFTSIGIVDEVSQQQFINS